MSKKKKKIHKAEEQVALEEVNVPVKEAVSFDTEASDAVVDEPVHENEDIVTDNTDDSADNADVPRGEELAEDLPVKEKKSRGTANAPRLVIILTAICVIVALLLGIVNSVTEGKIADNAAKAKEIAILAIFKDGNRAELYDTLDDGTEVYLVYRDEGLVGYCVFLTVTGFGGDIDMTVGINGEISTCGVKIVNMSETPGVGTKVKTPDFLEMFDGLSHEDPIGDVDVISGATISSKAVMSGVVAAHAIDFDFKAVAEELGVKILTPADILDIKETETGATTPAASEKDPQTGDGTTGNESAPSESGPALESDPAVQTEDIPYVDNGGEKYYVYGVDVTVASDRYVLEIKKEDETATFEKETKEPETEKQTEKATEAPTTAETTTAATAETTTTEAQTTAAPTTAETTTEVPTTVLPESSDTSSSGETTTGPEGTETAPVSPDTSEPADTNEPQELDTTGEGDAKAASEPKETDSSNGEDSVRK